MTCPKITYLLEPNGHGRVYRRILRLLKTFLPQSRFQIADIAKVTRTSESDVRFVLKILFHHGIVDRTKSKPIRMGNSHTVYWVVAREKL